MKEITVEARPKRIYIAGPMTGMPEHNFPAFNAAAARYRAAGWEVENPVEIGEKFGTWEEVENDPELVEALFKAEYQAVVRSDAILLLPGWENSRGTRAELRLALSVALDIIVDKGRSL